MKTGSTRKKILAGVVTCLIFLFVVTSLFGCKWINLKKSNPEFKTIYNEALDKTYNIPFEFPDPYDEKVLDEYIFQVYPMSPTLPMIMYFKPNEDGTMDKGTPIYALIYDVRNGEIVACVVYIDKTHGKYWVYRNGKFPELVDEYKQEDWLYKYDTSRVTI